MSTKIYEIHEYGGEWEMSFDYIVERWFDKKMAEQRLAELKHDHELYMVYAKRCMACPLYSNRSEHTHDDVKNGVYCNHYEPFDRNRHDTEEYDESCKCVNYITRYYLMEYCNYKIVEAEVF